MEIGTFGLGGGRKRELRIAQIVVAARQSFQEDGYAGFTTRRVAARVGITLGNLQYYFRTKEELLHVSLQTHLRGIVNEYREIATRPGIKAAPRCTALVERMIRDIYETDLPKFIFQVWALSQHDPQVAQLVDETYAAYRGLFARLLAEIQPTLTDEECYARSSVLVAQATGMITFANFVGDSDKDSAEFFRVAKRSVKIITGLSAQWLDIDTTPSGAQDPQAPSGCKRHDGVFASESHVQKGLFELSTHQSEHDDVYFRPTLQGKRREVKINKIVSCAANLLAEEGYANFTQARVAKELRIQPSALQNYFPTRDELLRSTISSLMKAYLERYEEMGKPTGRPALERLREIIKDVFEEARDPRVCRFSFELFALAQHSDITRELVTKLYSAYRAIYADLIREINDSITARECLARATLIAAQMDGVATLMFGTQVQKPDSGRVFELMKAITIRVARGRTASNDDA
jgi:AcrR family transcriptional regulator